MGLISRIFGGPAATAALGNAVQGVAEVFTPSATRRMELGQQAYMAATNEAGAEFGTATGTFDCYINGLNRLPRPMLALGTLGLFVYAMLDPVGFAARMVGLNQVPQPLWWLLGAIVSFYFGAREAHYFRVGRMASAAGAGMMAIQGPGAMPTLDAAGPPAVTVPDEPNAALDAWQKGFEH